jgi:hypothetical protein
MPLTGLADGFGRGSCPTAHGDAPIHPSDAVGPRFRDDADSAGVVRDADGSKGQGNRAALSRPYSGLEDLVGQGRDSAPYNDATGSADDGAYGTGVACRSASGGTGVHRSVDLRIRRAAHGIGCDPDGGIPRDAGATRSWYEPPRLSEGGPMSRVFACRTSRVLVGQALAGGYLRAAHGGRRRFTEDSKNLPVRKDLIRTANIADLRRDLRAGGAAWWILPNPRRTSVSLLPPREWS